MKITTRCPLCRMFPLKEYKNGRFLLGCQDFPAIASQVTFDEACAQWNHVVLELTATPLLDPSRVKPWSKGFTLIELMIAIAIVGILCGVAYPKARDAIRSAHEAMTKANLNVIRLAITAYTTTNGTPPSANIVAELVPMYLDRIPLKYTPTYHPIGNSIEVGTAATQADSLGDWFYFGPNDPRWGTIVVNCIHLDLKSKIWETY